MSIINKTKAKHPLLFIHIPKCAGGSVKYFFNISRHGSDNLGHHGLKFYNKNFEINNFFKFVSLRNPWDRLVSLYKFRITNCERHGGNYWRKIKKSKMNFKDWIVYLEQEPKINKFFYKNYVDFISCKKSINIDYIINFHDFDKDFKFIKILSTNKNRNTKMGLEEKKIYYHTSNHKNFKYYYNSQTIEIISKIHKRDIDLFGYDFDNYKKANYEPFKNYKKIQDILDQN